MDAPHHPHSSHDHHHQASGTSPGVSPSRLHPPGSENGHPAIRRGLKRPAQHTITTTRSGRERKWAKHCGCTGPCQAELFDEDDACEDLELEALENLLKRRRAGDQEPSARGFRRDCSDSDSSRASVSSGIIESDCESQPESSSSPPQLLHFLMMF